MIPDRLQYFFEDFWNFSSNFIVSRTFAHLFYHQGTSQNTTTIMGTSQKILFPHISTLWKSMCCQFRKGRAPTNPEEAYNWILKSFDMRSISIEKHEWILANMLPIPTTSHILIFAISKFLKFWTPPYTK